MAVDWDAMVLGPTMEVFGGGAVIYPASGATASHLTDAVFDEAYEAVIMDGGQPISTVMPVLGVRTAALAAPPEQNDQVQIAGRGLYVIRDVQPDGHGHALLFLNLVRPG